MYGYDDLSVSAPHKVGKFKYVVGYFKESHEPSPMEIYIEECQLNVTSGYDEYDDGIPIRDVLHVEIKYKISRGGKIWWVKPDEIFDTKEDLLKSIKKD